jgi:hypothetical protein
LDFVDEGTEFLGEPARAFRVLSLEYGSLLGDEDDIPGDVSEIFPADIVQHPPEKIPVDAGFCHLPGQDKGKSRIFKPVLRDVRHQDTRKERFFTT